MRKIFSYLALLGVSALALLMCGAMAAVIAYGFKLTGLNLLATYCHDGNVTTINSYLSVYL